jgi:hypothetical protein
MTAFLMQCEGCLGREVHRPSSLLLMVCADDPGLTALGYECATCGPRVRAVKRHEPELFEAAGVTITVWSRSELLADIRREQDRVREQRLAVLREFGDRLPAALDRILQDGAA